MNIIIKINKLYEYQREGTFYDWYDFVVEVLINDKIVLILFHAMASACRMIQGPRQRC